MKPIQQPKVDLKVDLKVKPEVKPKVNSKVDLKVDLETKPEVKPSIEPKVDSKVKPSIEQPKVKPIQEPKVDLKVEHTVVQPKVDSKVDLEVEPKVDFEVDSKVDIKAKLEAKPEVKPKVDSKVDLEVKPSIQQPKVDLETKPEVKPSDVQPKVDSKAKPSKVDLKVDLEVKPIQQHKVDSKAQLCVVQPRVLLESIIANKYVRDNVPKYTPMSPTEFIQGFRIKNSTYMLFYKYDNVNKEIVRVVRNFKTGKICNNTVVCDYFIPKNNYPVLCVCDDMNDFYNVTKEVSSIIDTKEVSSIIDTKEDLPAPSLKFSNGSTYIKKRVGIVSKTYYTTDIHKRNKIELSYRVINHNLYGSLFDGYTHFVTMEGKVLDITTTNIKTVSDTFEQRRNIMLNCKDIDLFKLNKCQNLTTELCDIPMMKELSQMYDNTDDNDNVIYLFMGNNISYKYLRFYPSFIGMYIIKSIEIHNDESINVIIQDGDDDVIIRTKNKIVRKNMSMYVGTCAIVNYTRIKHNNQAKNHIILTYIKSF